MKVLALGLYMSALILYGGISNAEAYVQEPAPDSISGNCIELSESGNGQNSKGDETPLVASAESDGGEKEAEKAVEERVLNTDSFKPILSAYYSVEEDLVYCNYAVEIIGEIGSEGYTFSIDGVDNSEVICVTENSVELQGECSAVRMGSKEYYIVPVKAIEKEDSRVTIRTDKQGIFIVGGIKDSLKFDETIFDGGNEPRSLEQSTIVYVLNKDKSLFGHLDLNSGVLDIQGTGENLDYMLADAVGDNAVNVKELTFGTETVRTIRNQFAQQLNIERISFPNGLVSIGSDAFLDNKNLTEISAFPESLTTIGPRAFQGCSSLTGSIVIPSGVEVVESSVFVNCSSLNRVVFSEGVKKIGKSAFQNCSNLTGDLIFPSTVKSIESNAFANCKGLNGMLGLPDGLLSIGDGAFYKCSNLAGELTIPNTVTEIGINVFNSCKGFTGNIVIPESISKIPYGTFFGCSGFNGKIVLHDGITEIGGSCFQNCSGLTGSVDFPEALKGIGSLAFANCSGISGELDLKNVEAIGDSCFYNCSSITGDLIIPDTLTSIPTSAFQNMTGINGKVIIPSCVTDIKSSAFANQISMKNFYIYGNPTMGNNCFYVGWTNRNVTKLYSTGDNVVSYPWDSDGRTITSMNSFTVAIPQEISMDVRYLENGKPPVYYSSFDVQINGDFENGSYGVLKKTQSFTISSSTGNTREVLVGMNEVVMDSTGSTTINITLTANNPTLSEEFSGFFNLTTVLHEYLPVGK